MARCQSRWKSDVGLRWHSRLKVLLWCSESNFRTAIIEHVSIAQFGWDNSYHWHLSLYFVYEFKVMMTNRFIGVNISERKSGTERTKKRKKRELVCFPTARGRNGYSTSTSSIEVFHSRHQNHVTAEGESILGVKFCNSCSGSGRQVIEISC